MRRRERRTARTLAVLATGMALLAAACGSDDTAAGDAPPATEAPAATEPTEPPLTDAPAAEPLRIVSLSPTHTEMLFAIGAEDQLVAVDDFSNFPAGALELPNELSGFEPNVEAIAAFEPDLVITGGDFTGLGDQLSAIGIDAWDGPVGTLADTFAQIEQLGQVTGNEDEAAALVTSMQERIDAAVASAPPLDEPLTIYHELDPTLYSLDSTTLLGEVYELLGLRNIADQAEGNSGGFPQLNAEFIVSADPDLIFLADTKCCGESAATVADRPGWDAITAVQAGHVFEMDDDIASRWGPRVIDYLEAVAAAVAEATA